MRRTWLRLERELVMNSPKPVHRIMFVCHGNICRSTMAEFVMRDKQAFCI